MVKKVKISGPAGRKRYSYGDATAYIGKITATKEGGYEVIVTTRRRMAYSLPKTHKKKNDAIQAAKAFVLKRG